MKNKIKYCKACFIFLAVTSLACCQKKSDLKDQSKGTTYFELYGNYLPTKEVHVKDHILESIQIDTEDSVSGRYIKLIFIQFTDVKTQEYYRIKASFGGTKDDFTIFAKDPILGDIKIRGKFFGVKGPMNDNIKDPKTIVFEGTFSVDGKPGTRFECGYFEGD